jgi:hypothetical protein
VFVPGKPFQSRLLFVIEAPFWCSTLGLLPGRTHKH